MEPKLDDLVLHPSLLIASGIECIDSRDVRFLNAYRRFFGKKEMDNEATIVLKETDFQLGGIMNPNDFFVIPKNAFEDYSSSYLSFPCLTKAQIFQLVYRKRLQDIFQKILAEITSEMEHFGLEEGVETVAQQIRRTQTAGIYPKIVALHLCGFGDKLRDAFLLIMTYCRNRID